MQDHQKPPEHRAAFPGSEEWLHKKNRMIIGSEADIAETVDMYN